MSTRMMERRVTTLDVRTTPTGRTVTAVAVTFNTIDSYDTAFLPGCFTESLARRMPRMVIAHNWERPIGLWDRVVENNTKRLVLSGTVADPAKVPDAAAALELLRTGVWDQTSVGFMPEDIVNVKIGGKSVPGFKRGRLDEVSFVVTGAVDGADVLSVRGSRVRPVRADAAAALAIVANHRAVAQARGETRVQTADIDAALALVRSRTCGRR